MLLLKKYRKGLIFVMFFCFFSNYSFGNTFFENIFQDFKNHLNKKIEKVTQNNRFKTTTTTKIQSTNSPTCYDLVTTCFTNGDRTDASVCSEGAVIQYGYNDRGNVLSDNDPATTSPAHYLATAGQVGSVWGTAYDKFNNKLYVSAFIRRHSDVGLAGLGAIYEIDMNAPPITTTAPCIPISPWIDINNTTCLGGGATLMPTVPSAASRGLGGKSAPSQDIWAFDKVGKEGIGDIELSADGSKMYVTDFTNQQIIIIDMASKVCTQVPITSPCGGTSNYRPFAITEHNGEVYIGVTCDGTGGTPDISHHIVQFDDPVNPTGTTITATWTTSQWGPNGYDVWQSWSDDYTNFSETDIDPDPNNEDFYVRRTQSMITDIEFAANGNMVVGMTSRDGFQLGWVNYPPTSTSYTIKILGYGDIQYATENAGNFTPNQPNSQWTFYQTADFTEFMDSTQEGVFIGGMVISDCCGTEYVTANLQDPHFFESNGTTWIDNATGQTQGNTLEDGRLELVFIGGNNPDNFGKAIALGDMEMLVPDCRLDITTVYSENCMETGGGTFTTNWQVGIETIAASDNAISYQRNNQPIQNHTLTGTTDTLTFPNIPADGGNSDILKIWFSNNPSCGDTIILKRPLPCPNDIPSCTSSSNCLGGNVFEDYNCNGTDDSNEPGVQGIEIQIYDCNNNLAGTGYSDADGDWQVCGLTDGLAYRVEFVLPESISCWAAPTHVNSSGNQTNVQFLTAPACTQFSVSNPANYCETDPNMVIGCYVSGDPLQGGTAGSVESIVSFAYSSSGTSSDVPFGGMTGPPVQKNANADETGTVWGMAYDPINQIAYAASFTKRHSGFGPLGEAGIYTLDYSVSPMTPTVTPWLDLTTLGLDAGQVGLGATIVDRNLNRGLTADTGVPDTGDPQAFSAVGRTSFGDMDITPDFKTLYFTNLFDGTLNALVVDSDGDPNTLPTAADLTTYQIPNPCGSGASRPFAIEMHRGEVYVGLTCEDLLEAYVYRLSGSSFIPVEIDGTPGISLAYTKGFTTASCPSPITEWFPWTDNSWDMVCKPESNNTDSLYSYPTAILADLVFDVDGSLIFGLMDRGGHQFGAIATQVDGTDFENYHSGGDILRACNVNGQLILEGQAGCASNLSNGEGPGGGEFYYQDEFNQGTSQVGGSTGVIHAETYVGGLSLLHGSGEVAAVHYDPYNTIFLSGGINWFDNQTGVARDPGYMVYFGQDTGGFGGATGNSGKANGLGDVQMLCNAAPLEIGNYVWCDSLQNGIQDACERGINDILVQLYNRNGNLVGQDTTSNLGQYYFNQNNVDTTGISIDGSGIATPSSGSFTGISYSTQYFIVFGDSQFSDGKFSINDEMYSITSTVNAGSNDNIDSDVDGSNFTAGSLGNRPDGLPFIDMTTAATGCGDHKYDLGLNCQPCPVNNCASVTINGTPQNLTFNWPGNSNTICTQDGTWCDQPAALYQSFFGNIEVSQSGSSYYRHDDTNNWTFEIPTCGGTQPTIRAAYLNWMGRALNRPVGVTFDTNVNMVINGGTTNAVPQDDGYLAIGDVINESGNMFYGEFFHSVADVTDLVIAELGATVVGTHNIEVSGYTPPNGGTINSEHNFGVGLTIIYECSDLDYAQVAYYIGNDFMVDSPVDMPTDSSTFTNPSQFSTEMCIEFPAGTDQKSIDIMGIFGGQANATAPFRGHRLMWLSGTGTPPKTYGQYPTGIIANDVNALDVAPPNTIWESSLGQEWDTLRSEITVPVGHEWVCIQGWSIEQNGSARAMSGNILAPIFKMNNPCPDTVYTLCDDGSENLTIEADAGLTDIMWLNEAGTTVGTSSTLIINSTTPGLSDGNESYYYTATDADGCPAELCCRIMVATQNCAFYSLGNRVFSDNDNSGDQNGGEAGIDDVQLQLLNADGTVYDSAPNTAGIQALIVTTANDGYYRFDNLPSGNYIVEVLATNFDSGNNLNMFESSTGSNQEAIPDNDGDLNDNGLDTPVSGAIRSGVITLGSTEPLGEIEPSTYGAGSTTGTAAQDDLSNLTVDFGFYRIPADYTFPGSGFPPCSNQPCHVIDTDLRMGTILSGDDPNSTTIDDSDGTVFPNNLRAGTTINLRTTITNNTGRDAYLYAWVDWNDDDDFDDSNENFIVASYPAAMFSGTYEVSNPVFIPSFVSTTDMIAMRFRLSSDQAAIGSPCGSASCAADGEIEDYEIQLECPNTICLPAEIQISQD